MAANQQSGKDKGVLSSTLQGVVVDKNQRDQIANFSKSAHFTFNSYGKWSCPLFSNLTNRVQLRDARPPTKHSTLEEITHSTKDARERPLIGKLLWSSLISTLATHKWTWLIQHRSLPSNQVSLLPTTIRKNSARDWVKQVGLSVRVPCTMKVPHSETSS